MATTKGYGGRRRVGVSLAALALMLAGQARARGQATMDADEAAKTRYAGTVAIWYGSHFEDSIIHDWVPIREWNGPFHPLLGEYKTDDPKVVRQHLRWLRRAGVDVILYDVCRVQPELTLLELPRQKTLRLIVDELSHQENEARKLRLVIWIEKWNSNPTAEQYRFGLDYIRKHLADRDCYFRFEGKPLVLTYLNGPAPELEAIDKENAQFFTLRRVSPDRNVPGWQYLGPAGDKECMTANPGADGYMEGAFIEKTVNKRKVDEEQLRRHGQSVIEARDDGKLFASELLAARKVDPKVIFISGWNDWAFCLQIEPAKEYGFKYVDLAARLLGREKETEVFRREAESKPAGGK